jgi:hypothetical protein
LANTPLVIGRMMEIFSVKTIKARHKN